MRALLPLALLALAAGCLEQENAPAGNPTPATGTTPTSPTATPTSGEPGGRVATREVANGTQSGQEATRRAIEDEPTWRAFWANHSTALPPEEAPQVDFTTERVVAVVLEAKPNGCWAVRIEEVRDEGDGVTATVTTYSPPPDRACIAVMSQPFHFVAIPRGDGPVGFEERSAVGPPPGAEG